MIAISILLMAGLVTWAFLRWVRLVRSVINSWLKPRPSNRRLIHAVFGRLLR